MRLLLSLLILANIVLAKDTYLYYRVLRFEIESINKGNNVLINDFRKSICNEVDKNKTAYNKLVYYCKVKR